MKKFTVCMGICLFICHYDVVVAFITIRHAFNIVTTWCDFQLKTSVFDFSTVKVMQIIVGI